MDVKQRVKLRLGDVHQAGGRTVARVVDQVVKAALLPRLGQRSLYLGGKCCKAGAHRHVQRQSHGAAAQRLNLRHDGLRLSGLAAVSQDDVSALRGQVQGHAFTQAAAAAGDDGDGGCGREGGR